ncbi:hypothetical protein [Corynebacterium aquilae]|uniref:Uncharacterized protein n=1 Tax=Corynebacterium aquilae DSM 44791 TaxID=1431546 RepID=A0A1L7CIK3_9CORY|nr:hypothetical protein [Corynebacterium aquilae]APT85690.1 hypothetical protein CAQU_12305 [Corynebacterium aquilae DSM 44791]
MDVLQELAIFVIALALPTAGFLVSHGSFPIGAAILTIATVFVLVAFWPTCCLKSGDIHPTTNPT